MKIELWPPAKLKPYANNPRQNSAAVAAVAASIKEFGFRQPIVVDSKGVIVVGHTRWLAAKELKLAKVPVHVAADLTPAQAQAYRLADNGTNELAKWDPGKLAQELEVLEVANEVLQDFFARLGRQAKEIIPPPAAGDVEPPETHKVLICKKCGYEMEI